MTFPFCRLFLRAQCCQLNGAPMTTEKPVPAEDEEEPDIAARKLAASTVDIWLAAEQHS